MTTNPAPLADRTCKPCRGDTPPMEPDAVEKMLGQLDDAWSAPDAKRLEREWRFPDFASALAFVNAIGAVAEEQNHHPDLELGWGRVGIRQWTHKIDGLSEADFVLAAKLDRLS